MLTTITDFARFDLAGAARSRWFLAVGVFDALLFGLFVWLGLRESTILGFTGMSRVVLNVVNVTLLAVPIVVLVATSQSVVRARTSGLLEFLLSQPVTRREWFVGLVSSRALVLLLPLFLMLVVAFAYGAVVEGAAFALATQVLRGFLVVAALVLSFLGVGLWVSVAAPSEEKALLWSLFAWLSTAALHDFALIGLLLRTDLSPEVVFLLAGVNPVEAARIALLANVDAQLAILGPVGFFISNKLGTSWAFAAGVAWPALVGVLFSWRALVRLERRDLIA